MDAKTLADRLQKQLNDLGGTSKGDAKQIEMLQKELYVLGQARDQLSKELDSIRGKYADMPAQIVRLEAQKHEEIKAKDKALNDLEEAK